jgi:hypothetical protein
MCGNGFTDSKTLCRVMKNHAEMTSKNPYLDLIQIGIFLKITVFGIYKFKPLK